MRLDLYADCLETLRSRLNESTAAEWSASELNRYINDGIREVNAKTNVLQSVWSDSSVANQQFYTLPSDFMRPIFFLYEPRITHRKLTQRRISDILSETYRVGAPEDYCIWEEQRKFGLHPVPSASAGTTTLDGSHSATVATITVASTAGFPTAGRIKVDSEIISYTNTTSTTFTGAVRGLENTVAATHSTAAVVTRRDIELYGFKRPTVLSLNYTTGTIAVTNASATVTGTTTSWTGNLAIKAGAFIGIGSSGSIGAASTLFPTAWYEISAVGSDTSITLTTTYREASASTQSYIITDRAELPEESMEAAILYAMYLAYLKDNDESKASGQYVLYTNKLKEIIANQISTDYLPVSKDGSYSRSYPSLGSHYPAYPYGR